MGMHNSLAFSMSPSSRKQRPHARQRHTSPDVMPTTSANQALLLPNTLPAQNARFLTVPSYERRSQLDSSRRQPTRSLSTPSAAPLQAQHAPNKSNSSLRKKLARSFSTSLVGDLLSRHSHTHSVTRPSTSSLRPSKYKACPPTCQCHKVEQDITRGATKSSSAFLTGSERRCERYTPDGHDIEQGPRWSEELEASWGKGRHKDRLMSLQEGHSSSGNEAAQGEKKKADEVEEEG